jgi:hypothetical protein
VFDPRPHPPPTSGRNASLTLFRRVCFALRLGLLLGTFAFTAWLVQLNQRHDPRFYWMLQSRPGQWFARHLVQRPLLPGHLDDPRPLDGEELLLRAELERELAEAWPTHRLRVQDGRVVAGRIVSQSAREIVLEEMLPHAGRVQTRWPTSLLARVEPVAESPPPVLDRDVRFKRSLPDLHYFRFPPFTLLTDQTVFDAGDQVEELRRLHRELTAIFAPLITTPDLRDGVQVLIFRDAEAYAAHCAATAPRLENSAGFYAPATGRLALFDQRSASHVEEAHARLNREAARARRAGLSRAQQKAVSDQVRALRGQINALAERASRETLRHEGAHQFLHLAGVHSRHYAENTWLLEGLASWCEPRPSGSVGESFRRDLREARTGGHWLDWEELLAHRSPSGFFAFTGPARITAAYAQSWLLTHWLMQPVRREAFFAFLRHLRDDAQVWEVATTPALDLLLRFLELPRPDFFAALDLHEADVLRGP